MPPKKFKPKQKRDRKAEAIARLRMRWEKGHESEEWDPQSEPIITPMLRAVDGGIERVIEALRAHDDDDAREFLGVYDSTGLGDRRNLPLETLAFVSGIGSLRLAELAQTALFLHGQLKTNLLMSSHLPGIVERSLKEAKKAKGFIDREWMLKAGKILPIPKGAQVAIQNVFADKEEKPESSTPAWRDAEDRLHEFHAMTDPKRLPSPATPPVTIGGHIDQMQSETVEIMRD
ncbi:MAG TPA: hypothetical protein VN666_21830 [Nitrospira sp.]|nr:hypothetical protein [Nitrospira sp.]